MGRTEMIEKPFVEMSINKTNFYLACWANIQSRLQRNNIVTTYLPPADTNIYIALRGCDTIFEYARMFGLFLIEPPRARCFLFVYPSLYSILGQTNERIPEKMFILNTNNPFVVIFAYHITFHNPPANIDRIGEHGDKPITTDMVPSWNFSQVCFCNRTGVNVAF